MLSVDFSITRHALPNSNLIDPTPKSNRSTSSIRFAGGDVSLPVAKRVVLVRHGQSTWNAEGRIQGSSNFSVLTEKGVNQAEISRQMLIGAHFDVCFASPLNRSKRTAEIIWAPRQEEIIQDYELREIDLYSFQGLLKHEGKSKFGDAYSQWQSDASNFIIDGHYPVRELWARATSCWKKVLTHDSRSVLVVAHNAVNQALIGTALGLGPEYFRVLVQSNCGVSALDFSPSSEGSPPYVCLNRLNQTPKSPAAVSDGRKASNRIILVCSGFSKYNNQGNDKKDERKAVNSELLQKVAELLSDEKVTSIISSPEAICMEFSAAISEVQKADGGGISDIVIKQNNDLDAESIAKQSSQYELRWTATMNNQTVSQLWDRSENAWRNLLCELSDESQQERSLVVIAPPLSNIALLCHCLNLTKDQLSSFHLDSGSITVIDFPDGPAKQGVIKCTNYTAHLGKWAAPITIYQQHAVVAATMKKYVQHKQSFVPPESLGSGNRKNIHAEKYPEFSEVQKSHMWVAALAGLTECHMFNVQNIFVTMFRH